MSKKQFDECLLNNGAIFISSEEMKHLFTAFGENSGKSINFMKLSQELGLHHHSFNIMRATHTMLNKLKNESRQNNLS